MIGRTLSHFRIVEKIGEGGMGAVYRAEDTRLRRQVALKVLPPGLVSNAERRQRFLREARAAAAVTHPNIATVYDVGEADGQVFIAMELVEGKTLREVIGGRPMAVKEAVRLGVELAEGLARAHQAGIIHRDLKPDNVIVAADGHAKILDFGLAKLREVGATPGGGDVSRMETFSADGTREGTILGTVAYMSPEQARGQPVDARSDIFSFGITLYEMLAGRVPFQGRTVTDTLSAITRDEPVPASRHNAEISARLDELLGKCLRKDPGERYQHADEVSVDLREVRRTIESGVQAARAARGRVLATPARRIALVAGLGAALALVGVLIGLNVGGWRERLLGAPGPVRIDSLVVLPLRNLSGDPEQEYFADGMTEELTATVARIGALKVISSTSAMYYKGKQKPLREIAAELDVDAVVEGSVMRSGERVRVTAQLVEGATDRHLWAASYERDLRDVLALQAEVARAIAEEVRATLTPGEAGRLTDARPVDPEAYEHYLAGRHFQAKLTAEGLTRAIEEFQRAIEKDPDYAPAYAGMAHTYSELPGWSVTPPAEAYLKGKAAVQRALELDPGLAEAHAVLGSLLGRERNWAGAEAELKRAIELNPNAEYAHQRYAMHLIYLGREDEALREIRLAHRLDRLSPDIGFFVAWVHHLSRRFDEALAQTERVLELHPDYDPARDEIGFLYVEMGRHEEGIAVLRERLESPGAEIPWVMAYLVRAYALAGREDEARTSMTGLLLLSERRYVPPTYVAFAYASLGDKDRALEWLDRALAREDVNFAFVAMFRWLEPLSSEPRFADFLHRLGLLGNR